MLFETILAEHQLPHEITNVFKRKNVTFFKIHNESFCTAAGKIAHRTSPIFDSSFIHIIADQAHDEDAKNLMEAQTKDCEAEDALWEKHKADACKLLFMMSLQILEDKGERAMITFINEQMDIYPTGAVALVKRLEKGE